MGLLRMPEMRSLLNGSLEIAILKFSLHGVLLFGLLNSLFDREAGKLEENSCEYRKDNGDYDIGHFVRMNKVKAFLLLEHGGECLSGRR